ncbi:MAG: hypothetical protein GY759_23295 [Chloroflexi bacterium]|nr:hypothetical protein [Chloroflexota bacterium]
MGNDEISELVTMAELKAVLPSQIAQGYQTMNILAHPAKPDTLLITILVDAVVDIHYIVEFDIADRQARWLDHLGIATLQTNLDHDRFVMGWQVIAETERPRLLLYDLDEDILNTLPIRSSFQSYPSANWHVDGDWLLLFGSGYTRLLAPEYDYQRLIFPPATHCTSAAFIVSDLGSSRIKMLPKSQSYVKGKT